VAIICGALGRNASNGRSEPFDRLRLHKQAQTPRMTRLIDAGYSTSTSMPPTQPATMLQKKAPITPTMNPITPYMIGAETTND